MSSGVETTAPHVRAAKSHLPALDGLRGLAILLVMMFHLLLTNSARQQSFVARFLSNLPTHGWIGLSLFFVLSGFLITGILYDTLADSHFFRNFYIRRVLRIFPLYYGFIFLLFLITRITGNHWYSGIFLLLTYTENLPISLIPISDAAWLNLSHFWSLAVEEQYYFVWPILVYLLGTRRRIAIAAASGMCVSLSVRAIWVLFTDYGARPFVLNTWTPCQLDGLFFGSLLAVTVRSSFRGRAIKFAPVLLAIGCAGTLAIASRSGVTQWASHPVIAVINPLVLALMFGGLLLCCLSPQSSLQKLFGSPALRFFGRYSYGLYVFHYPLVPIILDPMRQALQSRSYPRMIALLIPATVTFLVSVGAAWLSYRYLESPFLRLKDRFSRGSRRKRL